MSINTNSTDKELPTLERLPDTTRHQFEAPSKKINDGDDLSFFFTSTAYRDLTKWLLQLNRSMFPVKGQDGKPKPRELDSSHQFSSHIQKLRQLLESLSDFIQQAPPDTGPRRFGNVAFRTWYNLADEHADALLRKHLDGVVPLEIGNGTMVQELKSYLLGGFGSAQRLDYGTGHELSFLAFLACLWKLGAFVDGEDSMIVIGIIQPYLELVRELILTYTLEPAGSHGVWGLDDHSFIPYIFGSAQFGPAISQDDYSTPVPMEGSLPTSPSPSSVTSKAMVGDFKDSNMYFSAIQFIYDVKKGPFWEHSPVLYDISGIKDGWGKINKGMLKMYAAEVLGKFPVVQHFPFGSLFRWERDANAVQSAPTAHAQHQPSAPQSKDVPPAAGGRTSAPWARSTTTMPQMQSSTGMPSTRAPWASGGMPGRAGQATAAAAAAAAGSTTAPWASSQRQNQAGVESTAAPWAKKDSAG